MQSLIGYRKVIIALAGAILVVFGAVWMTALLPAMSKVPTDLDETVVLEGTYQVADSQTGQLSSIPVTVTRVSEGAGTEAGDILLVQETITAANSETGEDLTAMFGSTNMLAINRSTLAMMPEAEGADMARQGQWSPPIGVSEGSSFEIWNPAAEQALLAQWTGTDTIGGVDVAVFQISAENLALGPEEVSLPTGGTMTLDKYVSTEITLWIEPATGVVVNSQSDLTVAFEVPGIGTMPSFISDVSYTDATISYYADKASGAATQLFLFGTVLPWGFIGIGAILILVPVDLILLRRFFGEAPATTDVPAPNPISMDT